MTENEIQEGQTADAAPEAAAAESAAPEASAPETAETADAAVEEGAATDADKGAEDGAEDGTEESAEATAEAAEAAAPEASAEAETADGEDGDEASATAETEAETTSEDGAKAEAKPAAVAKPESDAGPASSKPSKPKKRHGRPRKTLADLTVGEKMQGRVVGLAKFGAFVDIGALTDGLVHITELPGQRVRNVEEVLSSGDAVEVWVKDVDSKNNRISLTMKPPAARPLGSLSAGDVVEGTITTITKYGAFVDIGSDTEGLVHVSEMSSGFVSRPEDIVQPGGQVEVRIKEIDRGRNRISLSMVGLSHDVGKDQADARAAEEDYEMPEEPEERRPTVVELALRKALGEIEDEDEDGAGAPGGGSQSTSEKRDGKQLTDVYARMLEEYRESE